MTSEDQTPNFGLRDLVGLICVSLIAVALVVTAFMTHAGPFILIAALILIIFGLLRFFREQGREAEAKEVSKALRSRLHKGEELLAYTIGDRRRMKPLVVVVDFALMIFTQGLATEGAGAVAGDDTYVGLTNRRLIAIDRRKRPPGEKRGWRERLNLRRLNASKDRHAVVFEAPREGLIPTVRLSVFYLAQLKVRTTDGPTLSIGINSRYWAKRAVELSQTLVEAHPGLANPEGGHSGGES